MQSTRNILCIDRDDDCCELVKFVFQRIGYKVTCAISPQKALELVGKRKWAAVILDYRLPNLSGTDVCRAIRRDDPVIPIVFFTGSAFSYERESGLAAGADAYLIKPNDFERLTKVVARLINTVEQSENSGNAFYFNPDSFLVPKYRQEVFTKTA